jgi:uncharacterized damage-inducible protein DinB
VSDSNARVDPPVLADETTTLRAFLDQQRDILRHHCSGLTHEQLAQPLPPSAMTLGGMLKHLAIVESAWFESTFAGGEDMPPFDKVDWEADPDWSWHSAADDSPEELRALFDEAVRRADAVLDASLAADGLDARSVRHSPHTETPVSLRWLLVHLIEEYARHNGHADLIRESIDGRTGD